MVKGFYHIMIITSINNDLVKETAKLQQRKYSLLLIKPFINLCLYLQHDKVVGCELVMMRYTRTVEDIR